MATIVLWFLVIYSGNNSGFFPYEFSSQAKCEQARIHLNPSSSKCFSAEVIKK